MERADLPLPICKSAIVCEKVIIDAVTGAHTLVSIFDQWAAPAFPAQLPAFWTFLQLDDGIGEHRVAVELQDAADRMIAKSPDVMIDFRPHGRGYRVNVRIQMPPPIVPGPGKLAVLFLCDDQELARQRIIVRPIS